MLLRSFAGLSPKQQRLAYQSIPTAVIALQYNFVSPDKLQPFLALSSNRSTHHLIDLIRNHQVVLTHPFMNWNFILKAAARLH